MKLVLLLSLLCSSVGVMAQETHGGDYPHSYSVEMCPRYTLSRKQEAMNEVGMQYQDVAACSLEVMLPYHLQGNEQSVCERVENLEDDFKREKYNDSSFNLLRISSRMNSIDPDRKGCDQKNLYYKYDYSVASSCTVFQIRKQKDGSSKRYNYGYYDVNGKFETKIVTFKSVEFKEDQDIDALAMSLTLNREVNLVNKLGDTAKLKANAVSGARRFELSGKYIYGTAKLSMEDGACSAEIYGKKRTTTKSYGIGSYYGLVLYPEVTTKIKTSVDKSKEIYISCVDISENTDCLPN